MLAFEAFWSCLDVMLCFCLTVAAIFDSIFWLLVLCKKKLSSVSCCLLVFLITIQLNARLSERVSNFNITFSLLLVLEKKQINKSNYLDVHFEVYAHYNAR